MEAHSRSVERTCEVFRKAYGDLVLEKGEDKITVMDIIKRTGLSRSAFYLHYADIIALRKDAKENFEEKFDRCIDEANTDAPENAPAVVLNSFSQFVMDMDVVCKQMIKTPYHAFFLEKMKQVFTKSVLLNLKRNGVDAPLLPYLLAGSMAELYTKYLEGELECTLLQINEKLMSLYAEEMQKLKA
jgi:AcrR family transcriptional regulator